MNAFPKIAQLLEQAHKNNTFDGVALVARGSTILHRQAYGLANREVRTPHTLDTPFPICSVTKQFTALLVMQQVVKGRLRLEGTGTDYLPDFRKDTGKRITLPHLLMHTSGLPDFNEVPGIFTSTDSGIVQPAFFVQNYCQGDLATQPGATFRYNNSDYIVLSAILERTTGTSFVDLLRKEILRPIGMKRTSFVSAQAPRSVAGYEKTDKGIVPENPSYRLENYGAAGAMQSTVDDLLLWNQALDSDRLLPATLRKTMFTADPSKGYTAYGTWVYGYQKYGQKTPMLFERQGGIGGIFVQNLRVPEDKISVILLSNLDTANLVAYTGNSLTCDILRAIYESS